MPKTVLYIDGQNFVERIKSVLESEGVQFDHLGLRSIHLTYLFNTALNTKRHQYQPTERRFYAAELLSYPNFPQLVEKNKELQVRKQRLHNNVTSHGFTLVPCGLVRLVNEQDLRKEQTLIRAGRRHELPTVECDECGHKKTIYVKPKFKEKGVDSGLVTDFIADACSSNTDLDTAIICSSDTDMLPPMKEASRRGIRVIYMGFQTGWIAAMTDRSAIFDWVKVENSAVVEAFKSRKLLPDMSEPEKRRLSTSEKRKRKAARTSENRPAA